MPLVKLLYMNHDTDIILFNIAKFLIKTLSLLYVACSAYSGG